MLLSTLSVGCAGFGSTLASIGTTVQAGHAQLGAFCNDDERLPACETAESMFVVADDALQLANLAEQAGKQSEQLVANAKIAAENFWNSLRALFREREVERSRIGKARARERTGVTLFCVEHGPGNAEGSTSLKAAPRPPELGADGVVRPAQ